MLVVLLTAACAKEDKPENTVDSAAPFELLCRYNTPTSEGRISYRISGKSITTKGQYDDAWSKVCDPEPETKVISCRSDVSDSTISINKKVYYSSGPSDEFVAIDRITGGFELGHSSPNEQETRRGACIKSENRAF